MSVPGWVYKRMAMGEISVDEVNQLEKLASDLSKEASIKSTLFGSALGSGIGAMAGGEDNRARGAIAGGITGGIGGHVIGKGIGNAVDLGNKVDAGFLKSVDEDALASLSGTDLDAYRVARSLDTPETNREAKDILLNRREGGLVGDPAMNQRYKDHVLNFGNTASPEETEQANAMLAQLGGGAALSTLGAAGAGRLARKKEEQEKAAMYAGAMAKQAQSVSPVGKAGARAAVADKSNNLHKVMKNVPQEDRDDVLKALRAMKKEAGRFDQLKDFAADHADELRSAGLGAGIFGVGTGAKATASAISKSKEEDIAAMMAGKELTPEQRKKRRNKRIAGILAKTTGGAVGGGLTGGIVHKGKRILPDVIRDSMSEFDAGLEATVDNAQSRFNIRDLLNPFKKSKKAMEKDAGVAEELHDARLYSNAKNMLKSRENRVKEHKKLKKYKHDTIRGAMKEGLRKKAAHPLSMGQAGMLLGGAALAPVVAQLASKGIDRLSRKSPHQIQQDLKRVLEVHPDIGRPEDPRVQMAYQSLTKLNPEYASDPLIAGPLLKQIVESRMDPTNPQSASYVDPGIAKGLSEARKAIREGNPRNTFGDTVGASMGQGIQAATLGGIVAPGLAKDQQSPGGFLY